MPKNIFLPKKIDMSGCFFLSLLWITETGLVCKNKPINGVWPHLENEIGQHLKRYYLIELIQGSIVDECEIISYSCVKIKPQFIMGQVLFNKKDEDRTFLIYQPLL